MRSDDEDMNMPAYDDPVWATLVRFSRPPLSSAEAAELERWLADDPARSEMVRTVQRMAATSRARQRSRRSIIAWARVSARLGALEDASGVRRVTPARLAIEPPKRAWRRPGLLIAAGLAASLLIVVAQRNRVEQLIGGWLAPAPAPRELATRVGQRVTVTLDDGSTVVLGPKSRLRYGKLTDVRERLVQLEGEAYFTVAPDTKHPFRVLASYATIQVVGTAFDVRAYPSDTVVQVLTAHGRVALRSRAARDQNGGALVERGERGTVDTSGYVRVVSGAEVERDIGWTKGQLTYQLVPLDALLKDLGRWYDVDFTIANPSLASVRVTIAFDSATTDDMVSQLAAVLDVPFTRKGRSVQLGTR